MATLLQFPSQQVQGLTFLEEQLRELLAGRGADQELMDFAARTMREIYQRNVEAENYSFSLDLPESLDAAQTGQLRDAIEAGIEGIRAENHKIIVHLIAELVLAEVKIFQHERDLLN